MADIHSRLIQVEFDDAVDRLDLPWRLPEKQYPYSCTDEEGLILAYVITENQLKSGFEIATAFGFSSLYIGMALKLNLGSLSSMDCYVEELMESFSYEPDDVRRAVKQIKLKMARGEPPRGLEIARTNAAILNLAETIRYEIGVSPEDVPSTLRGQKVDFAFIDGGHYGDQPAIDFAATGPQLADKCAVFFHDNNGNPSVTRGIEMAEQFLNTQALRFPTRFCLTLVGRGLDPDSLATLSKVVKYRHT